MTVTVFFAAGDALWPEFRDHLSAAFTEARLDVSLSNRAENPETVDYIIYAPGGIITDFTPYTRCKMVQSLWAGVERYVSNPTLTQTLCRMVDTGLTEGMVEYVVGHTLRHHLGMDAHIHGQDGVWRNAVLPPIARERKVTILGLGELGSACARALAGLNFNVTGWSRTPKSVPGVACLAGPETLDTAVTGAEIVVLLLPRTAATENTLDRARLALLAPGAAVINPGRGPLIDDDALLEALDSGQVGHATLDVFRVEPLPPDHPYWAHPAVTVTPHIAADTRPVTAARVVAENIRRGEAGEPFLHPVDRALGY
ncbi:MAG: glyoxylate/hydroxypyruvate reductase A [Paracoccaceae bacterium]